MFVCACACVQLVLDLTLNHAETLPHSYCYPKHASWPVGLWLRKMCIYTKQQQQQQQVVCILSNVIVVFFVIFLQNFLYTLTCACIRSYVLWIIFCVFFPFFFFWFSFVFYWLIYFLGLLCSRSFESVYVFVVFAILVNYRVYEFTHCRKVCIHTQSICLSGRVCAIDVYQYYR